METGDLPISILQSLQSLSVSATTIEFDRNFASDKTCEELVAAINHVLQLHACNNVEKFHLYFGPPEKFLPDIENWVAHVARKGVKEINLDFSMGFDDSNEESFKELKTFSLPTSLFRCETLTSLSLSHCNFCPPAGFVGFQHLQTLSLTYVNITGEILQQFVTSSSLLDSLRIAFCTSLDSVMVSSQSLRKLTVENPSGDIYDIEISAPKLESFIFYGVHCFGDSYYFMKDTFVDISSLSDAFIFGLESNEPEHDFIKLVYDLRHVNILTVCMHTLWCVTFREDEKLPIVLENLKELQLLVAFMSEDLEGVYGFFRLCPSPFIEKLFIQLSGYNGDLTERMLCLKRQVEDPSDAHFNHLKVITVRNFLGCEGGMRFVSFLLQKAVNLESLVIITHPKFSEQSMDIEQSNSESETASTRINDLVSLHAQLSLLHCNEAYCDHSFDVAEAFHVYLLPERSLVSLHYHSYRF